MKDESPSRGSDTALEAQVVGPDDLGRLQQTLAGIDARPTRWSCRRRAVSDGFDGPDRFMQRFRR